MLRNHHALAHCPTMLKTLRISRHAALALTQVDFSDSELATLIIGSAEQFQGTPRGASYPVQHLLNLPEELEPQWRTNLTDRRLSAGQVLDFVLGAPPAPSGRSSVQVAVSYETLRRLNEAKAQGISMSSVLRLAAYLSEDEEIDVEIPTPPHPDNPLVRKHIAITKDEHIAWKAKCLDAAAQNNYIRTALTKRLTQPKMMPSNLPQPTTTINRVAITPEAWDLLRGLTHVYHVTKETAVMMGVQSLKHGDPYKTYCPGKTKQVTFNFDPDQKTRIASLGPASQVIELAIRKISERQLAKVSSEASFNPRCWAGAGGGTATAPPPGQRQASEALALLEIQ